MQHLPTDDTPKPAGHIDNWPMGKLNLEERRESRREITGYYMSRDEFAVYCKAMGDKYGGR